MLLISRNFISILRYIVPEPLPDEGLLSIQQTTGVSRLCFLSKWGKACHGLHFPLLLEVAFWELFFSTEQEF